MEKNSENFSTEEEATTHDAKQSWLGDGRVHNYWEHFATCTSKMYGP